ncbi:NADPH-dependent 2,4-dienoyl-CoA reductase/sulfur reductase-like enzyme/rhodanese-related sulfurtransferase [Microbacterium proteolyticum]|uniref:NADPH-dependent 2,4-dienoyl-CoA reductase/sulfur reductase-like enzyme/rhodanese-related sulfurtransferase n=1 Tax=Microbacterium proteolyticum TaxID=1572644 RepID=A0A7W5CGX6_9MICO|nr:FAD-dependent oxidoreductase [Microbacterium proteolyticum]MBB3157457.1 NADPH-dependent 2,4-dienoyl-CoA reductase/sulfur reductase-like enzyme/rhodanese-related sulfurtransferase [Microbacterium proteolyticum]
MKTVIIGGVAAGMSAATRLRRLDETRDITVYERGAYVSFANCGLPYHVGGVITERSSLLLQTPESLAARFALDVRVRHDVVAIDTAARTVTVRDIDAGTESVETYDDLVIATGAAAAPGPSAGAVPTHTLRSVDDVDRVLEVLADAGPQPRVVVAGAGFIGLEAVENLVARGARATLVTRGRQVLSPLDAEMAAPLLPFLREHGVDVRLGATIVGAEPGRVLLDDGGTVDAVLVVEASGVRPDRGLAEAAGLEVGPTGGIAVDARHRTSSPHVWAVGDGVEKRDHVGGEPALVTMAGLANRHGRAVADDIAGLEPSAARPALGTAVLGLFGATVAFVGWSERRLVADGRAHRVIHTHPASHATYYPGAQSMAMKLLVDPASDLILGAQIVGGDGVDKRIDVIAVAMAAGLTASALSQLELAYAPQYGSAKDPVNMIGYVAQNLAEGTTDAVQWHELPAALGAGAALVDVRTPAEFAAGAIPGAVNLPLDELRERHGEIPDGAVIVHCQVGQRGHTAARLLTQLGYVVRNLDGGYRTWLAGREATAPTLDEGVHA